MVSDEDLVRLMSRGDQVAFEAFVNRYHGPLLGYLDRKLHNPQKAEDFVQETFIRLIRQLRQGPIPDRVRPWLYKVAHNLCRDYWRSSSYRANVQLSKEIPDKADIQASVVDIYERQETRKELLQTLNELPDIQRDIIILRFFQELKLQEIADVVDLTLSGVKSHLYQALKKLKRRYDDKPAGEAERSKGETVHAQFKRS
ncbi:MULTISPECIES: RNA polymerase sigma factor [unclassified Paenibacillus]|uniref:RNA polymerase sigma factor n=1 Tax=unclassified Paenibacillus TaxID=185978 RepID=UPI001AE51F60|nr:MULTISPECIES: RNA polymerase sigma factor [unclassified Paenibacillus]MBP1154671.1 RNA polymerase sigma-70 factor (ECF subfamily) [Paenibacillus sp. PvP091]MBP1169945.1 RNA polymerase sigma-70 factor (ECF subfamily) [Paenibacillus sp. PvR098]MBP2440973.1 RNA polymerase sigma-70 factor (ECF subfamily) [Paenibacillus sp. PvP052]